MPYRAVRFITLILCYTTVITVIAEFVVQKTFKLSFFLNRAVFPPQSPLRQKGGFIMFNFFDWNNNGRRDPADSWISYQIYKDCTGKSGGSGGSGNSGGSGGSFWIVVGIITVLYIIIRVYVNIAY